jgi:hypothetical protein
MRPDCPLHDRRYRPAEEAMLALPGMHFGLDVVMAVGSMRFREDTSFPKIHERLVARGVPIAAMTVQYVFRNYLALANCVAGLRDAKLIRKLRRQGGIVPVIDGVQFGEGDPVLYLITDALSHRPLFGKEFLARSGEELVPFIAQVKDIGVPILAVVSDKEKALGAEVRRTEEELRDYQRKLLRVQGRAEKKGEAPPADAGVSLELTEAARAEARRTARAPFDPPALRRHEGLETVKAAVHQARRKKGAPGTTCASSNASSSPGQRGEASQRASLPVSA